MFAAEDVIGHKTRVSSWNLKIKSKKSDDPAKKGARFEFILAILIDIVRF